MSDINQPPSDNIVTEPESAANSDTPPIYPYNNVQQSKSGHTIEMDDTPGRERLHIYHRSGTNIEIDKDGTVRTHIQGDEYEVNIRNKRAFIKGAFDITVDGPSTILGKDTLNMEVWGKTTVHIHNDVDIDISGDLKLKANNIYMESLKDFNIVAGSNLSQRSTSKMSFVSQTEQHRSSGNFDLDASNANINSGTSSPNSAAGTSLDTLDTKSPDGSHPEYLKYQECSKEEDTAVKNDAGENENFANEQVQEGTYDQKIGRAHV